MRGWPHPPPDRSGLHEGQEIGIQDIGVDGQHVGHCLDSWLSSMLDAASAARLRDGEIAMAARAALAEGSALLRVMEEKVWSFSSACGFFVGASGDTEFV
ncbi:hypothetical protein SAMCCGM7_pC0320 (plasmid) [Sinorhizobium americanum CCGM7]|nr:hypothetical protein SAMCCGM7_pC0320 [Sinorhizobium americanum CCGM7]